MSVSGVAKTKLSKSVLDAGCGLLRFQLTYKARWAGKHLVIVGRFFPSSRLCGACGSVNGDLRLADRVWTCGCGAVHDRIEGISQRMLTEALRQLERDGIVSRTIFPEVPVRMEYMLTALGETLIAPLEALKGWAEEHPGAIVQAREAYDREHTSVGVTEG